MGPIQREDGVGYRGDIGEDEHATIALAGRAVTHAIETGHDIDSTGDGPASTRGVRKTVRASSGTSGTETKQSVVIYCLECEWALSDGPGSEAPCTDRAIERPVPTDRAIDGEAREGQKGNEPAQGWANEWPPGE